VADTYNNMANVLDKQGKLEKAMGMYSRALSIRKKTLAGTYNNMALTLQNLGKIEEAQKLEEMVKAIREA
jgi:tetratricopeptide (TPR) repeat protein